MHVFFYHYNKPLSKKAGKPVISLHYKNKCYFVDNIYLHVSTWGHIRKDQPRFVIKGKASVIEIKNKIAYVY